MNVPRSATNSWQFHWKFRKAADDRKIATMRDQFLIKRRVLDLDSSSCIKHATYVNQNSFASSPSPPPSLSFAIFRWKIHQASFSIFSTSNIVPFDLCNRFKRKIRFSRKASFFQICHLERFNEPKFQNDGKGRSLSRSSKWKSLWLMVRWKMNSSGFKMKGAAWIDATATNFLARILSIERINRSLCSPLLKLRFSIQTVRNCTETRKNISVFSIVRGMQQPFIFAS